MLHAIMQLTIAALFLINLFDLLVTPRLFSCLNSIFKIFNFYFKLKNYIFFYYFNELISKIFLKNNYNYILKHGKELKRLIRET
jgi:hypothetical protein